MHISELETPVAVVDLERMERNLVRFQKYLSEHNLANRPHMKTHKIPAIAHMQVAGGAVGITCQKLGEAEVMADAGINDIFLPYNIIGEAKLRRLVDLTRRIKMSVTADSAYTVRGLSQALAQAGLTLETLVEFDTGMQRCGVQSPQEAAELARLIAGSPGLRFGGLMTFPFNENTDPFVLATKELLAGDKIPVERVTIGTTGKMWQAHTVTTATEYRSGMYIFGDRGTLKTGAMTLEDISLSVICTVVSRPTATRGIIDGGSKTFSADLGALQNYGLILEYPAAKFYGYSEEHGHVDFSDCPRKPEIGERVTIIPNHVCPVVNLFNHIVGYRDDVVDVVWPIAARGLLT